MSGSPWLRTLAAVAALGLLVTAQIVIYGRGVLRPLPVLLAAVLLFLLIVFEVLEFIIRRAGGQNLRVAAYIYPRQISEVTTLKPAVDDAKRIAFTVGGNGLGGYIEILPSSLCWLPGALSHRMGISAFDIPKSAVKALSLQPIFPGLGRLASKLSVQLHSGQVVEFRTRDVRRVRSAVRDLLYPLEPLVN